MRSLEAAAVVAHREAVGLEEEALGVVGVGETAGGGDCADLELRRPQLDAHGLQPGAREGVGERRAAELPEPLADEGLRDADAALAQAFERTDVYVILGCQGRDTDEMVALATEVERLAAAYPAAKLAIACRPPHDARLQDDLERYYRRLAGIARRPVIVQTYCSDKVPIPSSELLIRLARTYPSVYGWIKEETGGADANARMRAECRASEVKTVFSAWGSYGWLDQHRRFGTRGVISERAAYADFLMAVWLALEAGDAARADDLFAKYLLMMNLKETIPGGHLRGFNLYVLKRRGIFRNYVSRDYMTPGDTSGQWKLEMRVFTPDEIAAIDDRLSRLAL